MGNHFLKIIFIATCESSNYHNNNYGKACSASIVGVTTIALVFGKLVAILNIDFRENSFFFLEKMFIIVWSSNCCNSKSGKACCNNRSCKENFLFSFSFFKITMFYGSSNYGKTCVNNSYYRERRY